MNKCQEVLENINLGEQEKENKYIELNKKRLKIEIVIKYSGLLFLNIEKTKKKINTINLEKILSNHEVLKEIALKIFGQKNAVIAIKNKLIRVHGPDSKIIWQNFKHNTINDINIRDYPLSETLSSDELNDLVTKEISTFYTMEEIIKEAIHNGNYVKNSVYDKPFTFSIIYDVKYGEKCFKYQGCDTANKINITFEDKSFIKNIIKNNKYSSWKDNKQLRGSIVTIY